MSIAFLAPTLAGYMAAFVLAVFVPLIASYLLDGIVWVLRGRGLKLLALAAAMSGGTALVALLVWRWAPSEATAQGAPTSIEPAMTALLEQFLPFALMGAGVLFVVRMGRALLAPRARPAR